jgi:hypothetical protein
MWNPATRQNYSRKTTRYQSDLTDEEWSVIVPHLPAASVTGRPQAWPLLLHVIAKENLPALQLPALPRHHVDRNRGLRGIDAQFEQLAVDLGSAPQRVLNTHPSDQIAHLFADPWPATMRTGFPSPVRGEAHSMPTHYSLGPDDGYGVKNARTVTIEPN